MSLVSSPFFFSSASTGFYPFEPTGSLRFEDGDSPDLRFTPSTAGNRKIWTFSAWVKRANLNDDGLNVIFSAFTSGSNLGNLLFNDDTLAYDGYISGYQIRMQTTALFRDTSSWYHIVFHVDTTQATASDRWNLYVNGEEVTQFTTSTYPSQNYEGTVNNTATHYIGQTGSGANYLDGYLAEIYFIDGTAHDADAFGEFKNGVWVPKAAKGSLTFGTNGFYLPFDDSGAIGDDESGNGNDFTTSGLASTDVVPDSPTNNFAVFNALSGPNWFGTAGTYSEGNLHMRANNSVSSLIGADSTIAVSSGKWYWEIRAGSNGSSFYPGIGIRSLSGGGSYIHYRTQTQAYINGSPSGQTLSTYTSGDIIGVELDLDSATNTLQFYKNGTANGSTFSLTSGHEWLALTGNRYNSSTSANFGADSSFFGQETAQGNADENGFGDFYYSPSSGFLALCSANLPEPDISPADGEEPEDYFNTVLYTGNGSSQAITVGFAPDLVWVKNRGAVANGIINDTIRGAGVSLQTPSTAAELGSAGDLFDSLDSNGFTVNALYSGSVNPSTNKSANTYVGWSWLAGGTAVSNTDGSITSSVSANTKAGFSIVSYTGNHLAGATVGHGLDSAPELVIIKNRDSVESWSVSAIDNTYGLLLNDTAASSSGNSCLTGAASATTLPLVEGNHCNEDGAEHIAYCFHSVEGYSKIGSYTGNGSSDGPMVITGHRPAWVLIKNTSDGTASWVIFDAKRNTYNVVDKRLDPDSSSAEGTFSNAMDFLSNGFKIRASGLSQSGDVYIFVSFAESPFKYAQAR